MFPKLMMKPFPSLRLGQQDWGDAVQGPLHIWPPGKEGLPGGCVLAEKGEPSGLGLQRPAAVLLAAGQSGWVGAEATEGAIGACGGSSKSPGFEARGGEALAG